MLIRYGYDIEIELSQPTTLITAMDVHSSAKSNVLSQSNFRVSSGARIQIDCDADGTLRRRLTADAGLLSLGVEGLFAATGLPDEVDWSAEAMGVSDLPVETLAYLNASRYCETDLLSDFAWSNFGSINGGWAKVQAICDFVHDRLTFSYPLARETRTAHSAMSEGVGVCRDFTHLAVTLCRCLNIPARYCNGYLGDIGVPPDPAPMDFNAWFEAFLGGRWHTFDARHNGPRIGRILIARGRDAADIPMITTFGPHRLRKFSVITEEVAQAEPLAA
jgi:transglutaminase-like putative cysteine protease